MKDMGWCCAVLWQDEFYSHYIYTQDPQNLHTVSSAEYVDDVSQLPSLTRHRSLGCHRLATAPLHPQPDLASHFPLFLPSPETLIVSRMPACLSGERGPGSDRQRPHQELASAGVEGVLGRGARVLHRGAAGQAIPFYSPPHTIDTTDHWSALNATREEPGAHSSHW